MSTFHIVNMEVQTQTWLFETVLIALLSPTSQAEISYEAAIHSHWEWIQADGIWGRYHTDTHPFLRNEQEKVLHF